MDKREKIKLAIKERLIACGMNVLFVEVIYQDVQSVDPSSFQVYYDDPITLNVLDKVSKAFATREIKIDCQTGDSDDEYHNRFIEVG